MLPIDIRADCQKFLKTCPHKHQKQIAEKILALRHDPSPQDSITLKGNLKRYRRVDTGEYRIIYRVQDNMLFISEIGKRNDGDVYRRAKRRAG